VVTNLTDVGFNSGNSELESLATKCFQNGRATRGPKGTYIVWSPAHGIELWAQLSPSEEMIGLNPHFFGKTRTSVGLMQRVTRTGFAMDGGFASLAQPFGNDPIRGAFAFVFDTPDFLTHEELKLPAIRTVQLTAFAQQCNVFANEADFKARITKFGGKSLPSDTFLPLGLTGPNREPIPEPLATAMLCGTILDASLLTNPVTKNNFWWMKLRNGVGEIDCVADTSLLPHGAKAGGVIQCTAFLSGRIVE
jgi:hypothetical protein